MWQVVAISAEEQLPVPSSRAGLLFLPTQLVLCTSLEGAIQVDSNEMGPPAVVRSVTCTAVPAALPLRSLVATKTEVGDDDLGCRYGSLKGRCFSAKSSKWERMCPWPCSQFVMCPGASFAFSGLQLYSLWNELLRSQGLPKFLPSVCVVNFVVDCTLIQHLLHLLWHHTPILFGGATHLTLSF